MRVIVIGAGVAGLAAARRLTRAGVDTTVVEARDRLGGRVFTAHDAHGPFELGAEFIHGDDAALGELLDGIDTVDVPDVHHERRPEGLVRDDRFFDVIERFTEHARGWDGPIVDRLATFAEPSLPRSYVEGFHAADPARFSTRAFVHEEAVGGEALRRLPRGLGPIVDRLAEGLTILTGTIVHEVQHDRQGVRLATNRGELLARAVIVTVPIGALPRLRFAPGIVEWENAARAIGFGDVARVVLRLSERTWPADASFLHALDAALPVFWTEPHAATPTIVGWAGGPAAARIRGDRGVVAVAALSAILGRDVQPIAVHTHDWRNDPYAGGAYSWVVAGAEDAPSVLGRPVDDTIFFAGEALAEAAPRGTIQGALESGERAASLASSTART
ncbi:MAG: FAD-dependent oxidoreductase [Deltaproteobacteria bacterium]|nr:FAD-dependent oxidoreductase [Deltaproteobacteria bacterium]